MKNGSPCSVYLQAVTLTVELHLDVTSSTGSPCAAQRTLEHETLPSAIYQFFGNPNPKYRHGLSLSKGPPAMTDFIEYLGNKPFSIITLPLADSFKSHTLWSYRLCLSPKPNPRGGLRLSQWPPAKTHLNNFTEEKSSRGLPLLLAASHQVELHV